MLISTKTDNVKNKRYVKIEKKSLINIISSSWIKIKECSVDWITAI